MVVVGNGIIVILKRCVGMEVGIMIVKGGYRERGIWRWGVKARGDNWEE